MTESWIQTLAILGSVVVSALGVATFLWRVLGKRVDDAKEISEKINQGIGQRIDDIKGDVRMITDHLLNRPEVRREEALSAENIRRGGGAFPKESLR